MKWTFKFEYNQQFKPVIWILKLQQMDCVTLVLARELFRYVDLPLKKAINYANNIINFPIQIDHQPDATISPVYYLTFIYSSTCFGRSPAHHQELNDCSSSLWFYLFL